MRVGNDSGRLGVNCNPEYTLDVVGAGRFTGIVTSENFVNSSDARIKAAIENADQAECARLVRAIQPQTYRRTDLGSDARRIGYLANYWDRQLPSEFRNIMGSALANDGTQLLALDYSRIVPILHGALLSALARIEALESRV